MKKLIALCAVALLSFSAFATTPSPVSLLNPAGSAAGQAIVSAGANSAPGWAAVSASALTGILPVANGGTGGTTAAAELARIGAAKSGVNTDITSLSSPAIGSATATTAGVGTNTTQVATTAFVLANAVSSTNATLTTPNIVGVTNGSSAAAGSVGEAPCITAALTSTSSGTVNNLAQINVAAGEYLITGWIHFVPAATTVMQGRLGGSSVTSASVTSATAAGPDPAAGREGRRATLPYRATLPCRAALPYRAALP